MSCLAGILQLALRLQQRREVVAASDCVAMLLSIDTSMAQPITSAAPNALRTQAKQHHESATMWRARHSMVPRLTTTAARIAKLQPGP